MFPPNPTLLSITYHIAFNRPGAGSGAALAAGTCTVKSEAKMGTTLLDTKSTTFTIAEPTAAPAIAVSATPAPGSQRTVAVPGATGTPAASGTPEAKPTYAPLGAATIVTALGAVGFLFVMRRKA